MEATLDIASPQRVRTFSNGSRPLWLSRRRPPTAASPKNRKVRVALSVAGALVLFAASLLAQSGPPFSFDPDDQPHAGDSISPYNGQLALSIPIGPVYQVGPGLSFQARLNYTSRVWGPGTWALWGSPPYTPEPYMVLQGDPALGLGWSFSLGKIVEAAAGIPAAYIAPDGSAHRLYDRRVYCASGCPPTDGFFYTRDGSFLRVKYINSTSGYQMWSPNGNLTTFGHQVTGYDDSPTNYYNDYGRGRNGWHATSVANPYGDAITITYQSSYPWVPYQITIPSIGAGSRVLTVNMSGSLIGSFTVPTFNGSPATYTLNHTQHGPIQRPITHPTPPAPPPDPTPYFLDQITLPISGYTYSFGYYGGSTRYARGALSSQTIPTGATITYDYGTWTFYHANPLNRPYTCGYPPPPPPPNAPIYETGPGGIEPSLPPVGDCASPPDHFGSPDRFAGVVQRTVTLAANDISVTKYYQWDYPFGESGTDAGAQTQTLVLSPKDAANNQHSTTYLFSASTGNTVSGPLVGALLRQAVYAGDQSSGIPSTSSAKRVWRYTYDTDPYNQNPSSPASESFEANRRLLQSVVIYSGIDPNSPPTGKYHVIDYQFDANAGQYKKETHSGTIGGDAREVETVWSPLMDSTHWKLDMPATLYLRATAGGSNFSTVTNLFDSNGFPTSTTITDGSGGNYGTLVHSTPRDSHGFPTSETFTHGSSSYTRNLSFQSGTLKTAQWTPTSVITWLSANNQIDSTTGVVSMSTDPAGLPTSFTYDLFSRPKVTTPPGGDAPTTMTYVSPTVTTSVTSLGATEYAWSQTTLDTLGRPLKVQRHMPNGTTVKKIFRYDHQGNTTFESEWVLDSVSDSTNLGTSFTSFDDFARPKTITLSDGKTTTIDYSDTTSYPNSVWLKTVTINDVGGSASTTKYVSDSFGNLTKVTEPTNEDTTYTYNPQNRLTQVTQGVQTRSYTYDAFGFLRKENFPEKQNQDVTYSTHDALGNVLTETQPSSLTINRAYDPAGRLTGVTANSVQYLTSCYDGTGSCSGGGSYPKGKLTRRIGYNPASTPNASFTEDFTYSDPAGRQSAKTTSISTSAISPQTENWIYNPIGQVVQYSHPRSAGLFAVATAYDHGLPTAVRANGLPVVVGATYQPSGLLDTYVTGNDTGHNVTTTVTADTWSMPRPGRIATSTSGFDTGTYTYDGAGNIKLMGSDTFGYDNRSRLTSAAFSGGLGTQTFSYDRYGNLTGTAGPNPRSYTVSTSTNRLTSSGATYDSRGNLLTIGTDIYTYDSLDRIRQYQAPSISWTYLYDGRSERLVKIPPSGATSDYVWTFRDEANHVATEYVGSNLSRDNVYLGNLLVGSYSSCTYNGPPGWTYYSSDHLGTPRLATDVNGAAVDSRKYWPYGDEASVTQPNPAQRLRFASMERDTEGSNNRYYDHARSYDFQLVGRFLGVDLLGGITPDPQSWNRYSYVLANPVSFVDPLGLSPSEFENDPRCTTGGQVVECTVSLFGSGGRVGGGPGSRGVPSGFFANGEFVQTDDLSAEGVLSVPGITGFFGSGRPFDEGFLASLPDFGGLADFSAGFGDTVSLGLSRVLRRGVSSVFFNGQDSLDPESLPTRVGQIAGHLWWLAFNGAYSARPFWQYYPKGNPGYSSSWLTRGWGWRPPYAPGPEAAARLSLPPYNPGTAVRAVSVWRFLGGPGRVAPNFGQSGGGIQYLLGGWPP